MPIGPVKETEDALTTGLTLLVAPVLAELEHETVGTDSTCKNLFGARPARETLLPAKQRSLQQFCMACMWTQTQLQSRLLRSRRVYKLTQNERCTQIDTQFAARFKQHAAQYLTTVCCFWNRKAPCD